MNLTITHRPAKERGLSNFGWLHSRHSFSFGQYHDPAHMGFRSLRVINDDQVAPGQGFGMHSHRDMEILSYVVSGQLEHRDSLGNGRIIQAGDLQYMSAGSGVRHSEFNPSADQPVHFLQIWIVPEKPGGEPLYADMNVNRLSNQQGLTLLASHDGADGSMKIRRQAQVWLGQLKEGQQVSVPTNASLPYAWVQMISGQVRVGDLTLEPGDGASFAAEQFELQSVQPGEFLLFRLD